MIAFPDFEKVDIRLGKIIEVEDFLETASMAPSGDFFADVSRT